MPHAMRTPPNNAPVPVQPALIGNDVERCIYCGGKRIARAGRRYKKHETLQLWRCHDCDLVFSPQRVKGKTYPLKVIMESLMLYYRGESRDTTARRIKERFGLTLPARTLSAWLAEYRELTTYARMRDAGMAAYRPTRLIRTVRLHHQQVYSFRIHRGKLDAILAIRGYEGLAPLAGYLEEMATNCPHHLFQTDARASQGKFAFDLDGLEIHTVHNHACRVANLVLQSVTHNKRRHDELQRFMLGTDSVTVAVEVPITLTPEDIAHFASQPGFHVPIVTDTTLTGHIDFVQLRNRKLHILDYKPGANREKPIAQLMVYALALSRRTGVRLFDITCAWFDEEHYFEFYPLRVVHKQTRARRA